MDFRNLFFDQYIEFKSWKLNFATPDEEDQFSLETQAILTESPIKIFEVGFGQAHFLHWAKNQGHLVFGVEVIPELVNLANQNGINAINSKIQNLNFEMTGKDFDLIVAFDILEHLTPSELIDFLSFALQILKPGGQLLARFPNGQSPFGRIYQNGDMTHVIELSGPKMKQLASLIGFSVLSIKNSARAPGRTIIKKIKRKFIYFLRDLIGTFCATIFWGDIIPMDPNITVILVKPKN